MTQTEETVSMVQLKSLAQKYLKNGTLKTLIMSEPDMMPKSEALPKIELFSKLLEKELAL